jgi:hypothetical protein
MKDNVYIIGYYHLPNSLTSRVYVQNVKTYRKDEYDVDPGEVNNLIEKLKVKYPDHRLCEFVY